MSRKTELIVTVCATALGIFTAIMISLWMVPDHKKDQSRMRCGTVELPCEWGRGGVGASLSNPRGL